MKKVLVDGHYGAVSLNIAQLICNRDDLEVICLEDKTKFTSEQRLKLLNTADIVISCQSSKTVVETLPLIKNPDIKVIDTSNAFRLSPNWAYGLPELGSDQRRKIASSRYCALPAAMVSGASLLLNPLIKSKIMPPFHPLYINSVVGYSSGGSNMISMYHANNRMQELSGARQYGLDQNIMQQKELMHACGISYRPSLNMMIDNYPNGILVTVPLHLRTLSKRLHSRQMWELFKRTYEREPLIEIPDFDSSITDLGGYLSANGMANTNRMQLFIFGDNDICLLAARYDNLGKGGAGACVQCMNLMLGLDEFKGL